MFRYLTYLEDTDITFELVRLCYQSLHWYYPYVHVVVLLFITDKGQ